MCVNCDPAPSVCVCECVCLCGQKESKQNGVKYNAATSVKEATIAPMLPDQYMQLNLNLNLKFRYEFFQSCLFSSVRSLQFMCIFSYTNVCVNM